MATCAACGAENRERARFCDACGAPLEAPAPVREQRKVVTVLFCDVAGSTALGETQDPESLRRVMARYFETTQAAVERHGGTVEKFIGDAVMAVFGVPTLHEDDALRALRAAEDMRAALVPLNEELSRDYGTTLELRMGVNTGEVVTGTEERLATGDAVNVAARLEQAAAPGEILLGEETLRLARDSVEVEAVAPLTLKGKAGPVQAHRLLRVTGEGAARRLDAPMVGRETELRRLRDAFDQAVRDRSCQLFTLLGAAGVGKSRLTAELLAGIEDATLVRGRCLPYGEGITYWPVVEVVKQLPALGVEAEAEATIHDLLGEEERGASKDEIAWAVRKLLEAAASEHPLVAVFDDVHWGEDTFLDLVEHVSDWSRGAPILLLCLARPELLDRRPAWGGGKLNATTLLLEPLADEEAERLLDGLGGVDSALHGRILEAAEGNPLFVEQMVALVAESGGAEVSVPPTIQALLAARLDQLDVSERGVLERGAVEGRVFHRSAVEALSDGVEVPGRLLSLVRKELVRPDKTQLPNDDAFRFRHLLVRDAAYEGLPKATRAELHERFAGWLEERGPGLVELDEILGYHLEQAYRYRAELAPVDDAASVLADRARERLVAAGRRAQVRNDLGGSVALLRRARALLPDDRLDVELELDLAECIFFAEGPRAALEIVRSLRERAAARADRRAELRSRLQEARILLNIEPEGRSGELYALAEEARPVLEEAEDLPGLIDLWDAVATLEHFHARNEAKIEAAGRALECARRIGDTRRERLMLPFVATGHLFGPTAVPEALAWIEAQERTGVTHPALTSSRAMLVAMLGRFDEARESLRTTLARVRELGLVVPEALASLAVWRVETLAGDHVAAERNARYGCELLERIGERAWLSTAAAELGQSLVELGRLDDADGWVERARETGASDDVATQSQWRCVRGRVLARRGQHAEAERFVREALARIGPTDHVNDQADTFRYLAEVLELAGRDPRPELERALALYEAKGNVVMAERTRAKLEDLRPAGVP